MIGDLVRRDSIDRIVLRLRSILKSGQLMSLGTPSG